MLEATGTKLRTIIVEDHALLRIGLKILLEQRNVQVVGEAEDGEQAVSLTAQNKPDVVLMDLSMPRLDGIEAAARIRTFDNDVKIIMLTSNDNDEHIYAALAAGANGYCLKETNPDCLINALETVRAGGLWLDSTIASRILRGLPQQQANQNRNTGEHADADPHKLTAQELEVLHLIVEGLGAAQIAEKMTKTESQVKAMEFAIMEKLAFSERTQSALSALRGGAESCPLMRVTCTECGREFKDGFNCCPFDGSRLELMAHDSLVGKVFADRYEILSRLGSGGMSIVYKARHKLLGRRVAIKLLDPLLCSDLQNARRFREEALASSLLNHNNVIGIFDFGLTPTGEPYLVMDYLKGMSLGEVIGNTGRISFEQALPVFMQVCDGLAHAHSKGVVHRDLKPSNIMLVDEGDGKETVKVIDFGIAKIQSGQQLTNAGEILGSPTYMSPEQCMGTPLDARSDVYSLGCALYEALTGDVPFLGSIALETMRMHIEAEPTPIPCVPHDLEAIVFKAMAKNPADRFQSMSEMRDALGSVMLVSAA